MLFLAQDQVSDIRPTAGIPHTPWLPTNIATEHRGVKLAVLVHEHELLAELVLEIPQIAPGPFFDRRRRRGMTITHPEEFTLMHTATITSSTAEARTPATAVKAPIAAQASPPGARPSRRRALCLSTRRKGSILNRRYGVNSQPALTALPVASYEYFAEMIEQCCLRLVARELTGFCWALARAD